MPATPTGGPAQPHQPYVVTPCYIWIGLIYPRMRGISGDDRWASIWQAGVLKW